MALSVPVQNVSNKMYAIKSYYDRKGIYKIRENYGLWIQDRLRYQTSNILEEEALHFSIGLRNQICNVAENPESYLVRTSPLALVSEIDLYNHLLNGMAMEMDLINKTSQSNEKTLIGCIQNLKQQCTNFYQLPGLSREMNCDEFDNCIIYLSNILFNYDEVQKNVFDELNNWQREQIRMFNFDENPKESSNPVQIEKLNNIQQCIELLVEVTFDLLGLIESLKNRRMQNNVSSDHRLEQLAREIRNKQLSLLNDSLIVDVQPNRVIKTVTNFTASIRWLVGRQWSPNLNKVECNVLSEKQARQFNRGQINNLTSNTATMEGNQALMDYHAQNQTCMALFKALNIKKIQRGERRGSSESVTDEKFCLVFQMKIKINNCDFTVSTLSAPCVVVVHGNQECSALATIIWDNAFSKIGRNLFEVPEVVPFNQLLDALNLKCFSETKRGLTDANRNSLLEKLFPNNETDATAEMTWTHFCKEHLPGVPFSFWEWFYCTIKLIKERLSGPWNNNLIEGFISKTAITRKLELQPPGTFMLRFSDRNKGAVSISYVNEKRIVEHITPWTNRDLQTRCLANRINDLKELDILHPFGLQKSILFKEFCTADDPKASDGYVAGFPVTQIVKNSTDTNSPSRDVSPTNTPSTGPTNSLTPSKQNEPAERIPDEGMSCDINFTSPTTTFGNFSLNECNMSSISNTQISYLNTDLDQEMTSCANYSQSNTQTSPIFQTYVLSSEKPELPVDAEQWLQDQTDPNRNLPLCTLSKENNFVDDISNISKVSNNFTEDNNLLLDGEFFNLAEAILSNSLHGFE